MTGGCCAPPDPLSFGPGALTLLSLDDETGLSDPRAKAARGPSLHALTGGCCALPDPLSFGPGALTLLSLDCETGLSDPRAKAARGPSCHGSHVTAHARFQERAMGCALFESQRARRSAGSRPGARIRFDRAREIATPTDAPPASNPTLPYLHSPEANRPGFATEPSSRGAQRGDNCPEIGGERSTTALPHTTSGSSTDHPPEPDS